MRLGIINRIKRARCAAANDKEYMVSVRLTEEVDREAVETARLRSGIGAGRALSVSRNTITLWDRSGSQDAEGGMVDLLTIAGEYLHIRNGITPEYNKWVRVPASTGSGVRRSGKAEESAELPSWSYGQHDSGIDISLADAFNQAGKKGRTVTGLLSEAMEDAAWRADEGEMEMTISNLGGIALPKSMVKFVERVDYRTSDPGCCACVSCGGTIHMNCNILPCNNGFAQYFVEELAYLGIKTCNVALNPA